LQPKQFYTLAISNPLNPLVASNPLNTLATSKDPKPFNNKKSNMPFLCKLYTQNLFEIIITLIIEKIKVVFLHKTYPCIYSLFVAKPFPSPMQTRSK
jgi:hypothetical protein